MRRDKGPRRVTYAVIRSRGTTYRHVEDATYRDLRILVSCVSMMIAKGSRWLLRAWLDQTYTRLPV